MSDVKGAKKHENRAARFFKRLARVVFVESWDLKVYALIAAAAIWLFITIY